MVAQWALCFAIPVNLAKQVMESIVQKGSVTRG
jgi:S1-C subfamily serine protease